MFRCYWCGIRFVSKWMMMIDDSGGDDSDDDDNDDDDNVYWSK